MKTVTSGRDTGGQPLWTPALLQLAGEFGFHPQACDPGAGNQKGSVEALVKWVKGNFLPGRTFTDDRDLVDQAQEWERTANSRASAATGVPPCDRLPDEAAKGTALPATAHDYGVLLTVSESRSALRSWCGSIARACASGVMPCWSLSMRAFLMVPGSAWSIRLTSPPSSRANRAPRPCSTATTCAASGASRPPS